MTEATDYLRKLQGKPDDKNCPPHLGVHIVYLPRGVEYPEGESGGGWYIQLLDGVYGSDPIGPYHTAQDAWKGAEHERLLDSQETIEAWANSLPDDTEPFEWS